MAEIEKLDLTSMDIKEHQIEKLKELFPEAFTEGNKIDWDRLRRTLGEQIDAGKERYGMNWPGKADCFRTIQQPSIATLVPAREESVDFDTTQNLFIEGDNLEALKLLQKSYLGKIKMIYIDPPYNTGNDFIYPDNYTENLDTYLAYTGQVDAEGRKFATNTETDGRFHSKWLNMMYPRLFLAKNLLREDGVIFISIDDNAVLNLRTICNEVFGEENFIAELVWQKKTGAGAKSKGFIRLHEYVLCYAKSISPTWDIAAPMSEKTKAMYNKKDEYFDQLGPFATWPLDTTSMDERANLRFPIFHEGNEIWPRKQWLWSRERVERAQQQNKLVFNHNEKDNSWSVRFKGYLYDEDGEEKSGKPTSVMIGPYTQEGTKDFQKYFDRDVFPFPKPVSLLKQLLSIRVEGVEATEEDIALDFFAGSSTTGEAVLRLNQECPKKTKFILVQLPEPCTEDSEAYKAGYKTIADIGKERLRMVIKKIKEEHSEKTDMFKGDISSLDLGFKVFKLSKSNFNIWDSNVEKTPEALGRQLELHTSHISAEASQEAILFELLLKSGFELTTPIEKLTLEGKTVYSIAEGELLICLDKHLTNEVIKAMAERKPSRVICLDEGFQDNDQLKTNAVQIMKSKNVVFRTV
ncbi:MAG: site-specific DNA-methyltransferase [Deltaproteobacteria bacterium]|nr:site-specific DNA-methyltransferase [Deltaproteobacteria bacterium]